MARPQNCYDPAGPIQEIIVPEELGPNDARLREFTTACRDLATETHRKAKVIFGRDILRLIEAQRIVCLKTVVRSNPRKIPITVVSSQPSHAVARGIIILARRVARKTNVCATRTNCLAIELGTAKSGAANGKTYVTRTDAMATKQRLNSDQKL
ncbi:hypothetical protein QAD02_020433 [Eretmocerus hayati]|uniref:Uncharacterized protein n=1 Tax=Eretmocerus hayati TaxID=131215 RepID=A0ACC2PM23_9HYME|nr:hypothetical protein QAD02_020433 [Eretmocerus hayati]